MDTSRYIALTVCALAAAALAALLVFCRLEAPAAEPRYVAATLVVEEEEPEEFVDFLSDTPADDTPEAAFAPEAREATAEAAEHTAPVQPTPQELQARARDEASRDITQAFKAAEEAKDNTTDTAEKPAHADSGSLDNNLSAVNGSGQGSVGGGWIMPQFAKVRSTSTGRIELRATVDASGRVTRVVQTGGKAPAGTDAALVARCIAEVRSRRFTRNDDNAPATATARIVYTFK